MAENKTFVDVSLELGSFWMGVMAFISVMVLFKLLLISLQTENFRMFVISSIFLFFLFMVFITAIIFVSAFKTSSSNPVSFWNFSWRLPSLMFITFFVIQIVITTVSRGRAGLSFLTIPRNSLLATFSGNLSILVDFFMNVFMAPFVEELVWIFFIVVVVMYLLSLIGRVPSFSFLSVRLVQIIVATIVSAGTFAGFHVYQQDNISFIVSAIIFRSVTILLFWGDELFNVFKFANVMMAATIGLHVGNNWGTYGFVNGLNILMSGLWGWLLIGLFVFMIFSAVNMLDDGLEAVIGRFWTKTLEVVAVLVVAVVIFV